MAKQEKAWLNVGLYLFKSEELTPEEFDVYVRQEIDKFQRGRASRLVRKNPPLSKKKKGRKRSGPTLI